ncbi:integrase [Streptomyces uncialis]|uniref:integrase n=1 Tax=Streptomyces uncialis TaxID=1048205 RepID=UPI003806B2C4
MPFLEWRGNSLRVRWETGLTNPKTGKPVYESKSSTQWDEDEALKYGLDRESDLRNGRLVAKASGQLTFREWSETWASSLDLDPTTIDHYRTLLRAQLLPAWGDAMMSGISTVAYQRWATGIKAKYSANYTKSLLTLFRVIMEDASTHQPPLIPRSPVPKASRKRGRYVRPVREEKMEMPTADLHRLAENAFHVWGFTGYVFMLTKAYTGMRIGEMYGLRREFVGPSWPESDPDKGRRERALKRYCGQKPMPVIRVQWQHKWMKDPASPEEPRVATLAPPKYGSERTLVIPPFLAALLEQLLASHGSEWVFPALGGGPLLTTDFYKAYWHPVRDGHPERTGQHERPKILPVAAFQGKRIHLIRHAHSPHLEEDGVPEVAIETRLGHILQGVRGVYADVTPAMERKIVRVLQARWERQQRLSPIALPLRPPPVT